MSELHAHSAVFVRREMIDAVPPPALESGALKWLRENLFSGWMNTLLTVLGILSVFLLVREFLPWFLHGVWNANSLSECREIIAATWGEEAHGACWAMIRERWNQFLFGFYPRDLYWRPIMAFLLLVVALAPVLFAEMSNKLWIAGGVVAALILWLSVAYGDWMPVGIAALVAVVTAVLSMRGVRWPINLLWFSGVYAGLTFWLLWGGSVWLPVVALLGFVVGWFAFRFVAQMSGPAVGAGAGFVAAVLWWYFAAGTLDQALTGMTGRSQPFWLRRVDSDEFGGFVLAFTIGVTGIAASLPMGIVLALGRRSDMPLVKGLCVGFIEFIRGVPLITLLFTASLLLNYFLPPGTNFDIVLRVIIMVTLFSAAYIAEVIRGGLAALPRGQYEAADALGLDYWKAQRLIIMPQALKISIPGIVSSFIGLFKDTTLVVFVALLDPLKGITDAVRATIEWKGIYWEPYIFVGAIFFIVCFSMSRYSMYLENKLKREHR
ncbi:Inner membrane amino-acid ABC transporter permease protein YhdY [Defluviimonas aquaemixtae]|uniref:Inner membrane amino-acid ABC transporter permease protein YhdY n=1 Tax=Albidovulum aquaemixtae TaxID=1542388 RepID=A0A2R8B1T2_9RHOB|nr:amino acid ABC transporter permease [Defluviimonas aquaemixtae]SPH16533.1 Inner membrane amino-acid ABC transporter permease protein YhdY [Defluviimonas aquaemixtae]